ncbi:MAG: hypothetical protein JWR88_471 [Pseudonocardia sp.]|nr:hypothetical protein [Pseudonocardia sp.]
MFGVVARFDLRDQSGADAFDRLAAETAMGVWEHEPGTLTYATFRVEGEPLARLFYELYRDRDAFEEHESQPHTKRFLAERAPYLTSTRVEFLVPRPEEGSVS